MKTITLTSAVILAVGELRNQGSFSIHQITQYIRAKVNADEWSINGADVGDPQGTGVDVQLVEHSDVKSIFGELLENNIVTGLSKTWAGQFFLYANQQNQTAVPMTGTVTFPATFPASGDTLLVKAFLARNGLGVTLKQVTSAIKKPGLRVKDVAAIAQQLGYTVNTNTPFYTSTIQ